MDKNSILEIPYGTRDYLPEKAIQKRTIENKFAHIFSDWGYDEIVTPTIEYIDTLSRGNSNNLERDLFKLVGAGNRTLALRHEMTTPIARVVSSRLKDEKLPLKLSYVSNVYRQEQTQKGRQCEFYQAGVELMGGYGAEADAEVIALAIESIKANGLKEFSLCLGQVDFVLGLLEQYNLTTEYIENITSAIEKRDLVELTSVVDDLNISESAKENIKGIPMLYGGDDVLKSAYNMAIGVRTKRALDNISEIYEILKCYGVDEFVTFDLGLIRNFSYYTGTVFEAYTAGLGYPICGGGRYDNLLADFGNPCPATGFAIGIERLMLALKKHKPTKYKKPRDYFISYAEGKFKEAVIKARELRAQGNSVELSMTAQAESEAMKYKDLRNCLELLYVK